MRSRLVLLMSLSLAAMACWGVAVTSRALAVTAADPTAPAATPNATRVCAAPTGPGVMGCLALRRTDLGGTVAAFATAAVSGYGPTDLHSAYQLPASTSTATVAIVDAYDDPQAEADLAVYREQYGLPACGTANGCFRKVNQSGASTPLPTPDSGWAGEISLDIDMVSAVCPTCHILLVEAASATDVDLFAAVGTSIALGARFVSLSWGGQDTGGRAALDSTYLDHPGVAITASTGDGGTGPMYPATSRYVTAVGGTTLTASGISGTARGWAETAWSGSGSGCSAYIAKPAWQTVSTGCAGRAEADVSAVANPATGVAVYQTYGASGWGVYGGTSAAAPIVAAVYALAGTPGAGDYPAAYPYARSGSLFDVAAGTNGGCGAPLCQAGPGWDGPTGLGTPAGVAAFGAEGTGTATRPTITTLSAHRASTAGGTTLLITGTRFSTVNEATTLIPVPPNPAASVILVSHGVAVAAMARVVVLSDTMLAVALPARPSSEDGTTYDIQVTNAAGSTVAGAQDQIIYRTPITATVAVGTLLHPVGGGTLAILAGGVRLSGLADVTSQKVTAMIKGAPATITGAALAANGTDSVVTIAIPAGTPSGTGVPVALYHDAVAGPTDATARYAAVITALGSTSGRLTGGGTITITGRGLTGATGWSLGNVPIGDRNCTNSTTAPDTSVTCVNIPSRSTAGPVSVTFTSATGPFADTAAGAYTYTNLT